MHVRSCVCSVSINTHRTRDKLCLQCQPLLELTTALLSFNSLPLSARLSINAQKHAHTFVPASHSTHKHTHTLLCQPLIQVPVYIYSSKKGLIMVIVCMCVCVYVCVYTCTQIHTHVCMSVCMSVYICSSKKCLIMVSVFMSKLNLVEFSLVQQFRLCRLQFAALRKICKFTETLDLATCMSLYLSLCLCTRVCLHVFLYVVYVSMSVSLCIVCLYVCLYVFVHTYIHTYIHTYMHKYILTYMHMHRYIHVACTCIDTYMFTALIRA